jgi:hypothetical protein
MAEITLGKALKIKNRLTGRLAKVQADIQAYNSVPEGQADQVNVPALMKTREELVGALVSLKTAINDAYREAQRDIYDLAEKKATAQFLAGLNTRHGPQPAVYRGPRPRSPSSTCSPPTATCCSWSVRARTRASSCAATTSATGSSGQSRAMRNVAFLD